MSYRTFPPSEFLPWLHGGLLLLGLLFSFPARKAWRWSGWLGAPLVIWGLVYPAEQVWSLPGAERLLLGLKSQAGPFLLLWLLTGLVSSLALFSLGLALLRGAWKNRPLAGPWTGVALANPLLWALGMLWLWGHYATFGWGTLIGLPVLALALLFGLNRRWIWLRWAIGGLVVFGLLASTMVLAWRLAFGESSIQIVKLSFYVSAFFTLFLGLGDSFSRHQRWGVMIGILLISIAILVVSQLQLERFVNWEKQAITYERDGLFLSSVGKRFWKVPTVSLKHKKMTRRYFGLITVEVSPSTWLAEGKKEEPGVFYRLKEQFRLLHPNQDFPGEYLLVSWPETSWERVVHVLQHPLFSGYGVIKLPCRPDWIPSLAPPPFSEISASLEKAEYLADYEKRLMRRNLVTDRVLFTCPACKSLWYESFGNPLTIESTIAKILDQENVCCVHLVDYDRWSEIRYSVLQEPLVAAEIPLSLNPGRAHIFALPASMPWSEARPKLLDAALEHGRLFLVAEE